MNNSTSNISRHGRPDLLITDVISIMDNFNDGNILKKDSHISTLINLGIKHLQKGDYDNALNKFNSAWLKSGNSKPFLPKTPEEHYNKMCENSLVCSSDYYYLESDIFTENKLSNITELEIRLWFRLTQFLSEFDKLCEILHMCDNGGYFYAMDIKSYQLFGFFYDLHYLVGFEQLTKYHVVYISILEFVNENFSINENMLEKHISYLTQLLYESKL